MTARALVVAALLVAAWFVDRRLFAICAGIVTAWAIVQWRARARPEDDASDDAGPVFEPVATAAACGFEVYRPRRQGDDARDVATFAVPLDLDVPFAAIVRRKGRGDGRLVQNTPIPTARFEYTLQRVDVAPELAHDWEAASNGPLDLAPFLFDPRVTSILAATRGPRLESLQFDGRVLWVRFHLPETSSAHETTAADRAAILATHLRAALLEGFSRADAT